MEPLERSRGEGALLKSTAQWAVFTGLPNLQRWEDGNAQPFQSTEEGRGGKGGGGRRKWGRGSFREAGTPGEARAAVLRKTLTLSRSVYLHARTKTLDIISSFTR